MYHLINTKPILEVYHLINTKPIINPLSQHRSKKCCCFPRIANLHGRSRRRASKMTEEDRTGTFPDRRTNRTRSLMISFFPSRSVAFGRAIFLGGGVYNTQPACPGRPSLSPVLWIFCLTLSPPSNTSDHVLKSPQATNATRGGCSPPNFWGPLFEG